MAFEEYDDFEQEKLVKDWIKNNWLTIVAGLVIGLGSVFGMNFWKAQQQQKRFAMSEKYNSFTKVMELSEFDEAQTLIKDLENESGLSFYTIDAHLRLAKEYANKNELQKAADELNKVISSNPDQLITEFTKLRLARVYNAMAKHDEALGQAQGIKLDAFLSIAKEIQGDALIAKGETDKAVAAFKESVEKGTGYSGKKNIEMKIDNS